MSFFKMITGIHGADNVISIIRIFRNISYVIQPLSFGFIIMFTIAGVLRLLSIIHLYLSLSISRFAVLSRCCRKTIYVTI
jgi:hypothetical protein